MAESKRKVAFITGASRGIGRACARYLAEAGFDVAISARTVQEGESREHSSTVKKSNTKPLPGSLESTSELVRETGRDCLAVPADLLDYASLGAAITTVIERWGGVDVLVNNGRYIGPGHMDRLLDTSIEILEKHLQANVLAPILLAKLTLPGMIARGHGRIINISSASGYGDPTAPAGEGGWGMGYGISKGGVHRVAGFLHVEHASDGVLSFNVQPGYITTERIAADMAEFGFPATGQPPDVVGAVCAWLATSDEAVNYSGRNIEAQFFCHERKLLPWWHGPVANDAAIRYDTSGYDLQQLEAALRAGN